jgi:PAS domain S-box-containing protein
MQNDREEGTDIKKNMENHAGKENWVKESEDEYKAIFDSINDAIFIHNPDTGTILYVNNKTVEMYGYTADEFLSLTIEDISSGIPPYNQEGSVENVKTAARDGGVIFEWHAKDKSGCLFWVEVSLKPAIINDKNCILATVRDITERKLSALERERLVNELQEALAKVKILSGMMPICSYCKKIRDDKGYWNQLESYISKHSDALFSHSICPECLKKEIPYFYREK